MVDAENLKILNNTDLSAEDFLMILEEHKKTCERESRYEEAELTRTRLKELRRYEQIKQMDNLDNKHNAEINELTAAHNQELEELKRLWENELLPNYELEAERQENLMRLRHTNEIQEFKQSQINENSANIHYSPELLNLRKRQAQLASLGKYVEASKLKLQADMLEHAENERHNKIRKDKVLIKTQQLMKKQQKELTILLEKLKKNRDDNYLKNKQEINLLRKRYINVKNDLDKKQKTENYNAVKNSHLKKMERKENLHVVQTD